MSLSIYHADYESLRTLLRRLRLDAGLTQAQIGDALGLGQPYVSKLERGDNFVDMLLYVRWCQICGVRPGKALDNLLSRRA
jgi:transcriptional regulator with XRE-family HTH domain